MLPTNEPATSRVISTVVFATIGTSIKPTSSRIITRDEPPCRPERKVQNNAGKSAIKKSAG